ncbi:hypothetical protein AGR9A_Cc210463 [Agrobacterium salinitolerans str. Hayward 0363]|nr:hypothetical protein AGR9A_Cc210463 [Agrobacterium salinitolerans str. Hayward 0363]
MPVPCWGGSVGDVEVDEIFCGSAVERHGNIVNRSKPRQRLHVHIMRHGRQRVGEEDQHIHLACGDHRADLLVAAERTALEADDFKTRTRFLYPSAGGAGGDDPETGKRFLVMTGEIRHIVLFLVVSDERDTALFFHGPSPFHQELNRFEAFYNSLPPFEKGSC